jgi:hypothetical protein
MHRRTILFSPLILWAGSARAHHGWGSYDAANPVTISGIIQSVVFANPHVHIDLVTPEKTWTCTLAPPFRMNSREARENFVAVGQQATLLGYIRRDNPNDMRAEWIQIAGKRVQLR